MAPKVMKVALKPSNESKSSEPSKKVLQKAAQKAPSKAVAKVTKATAKSSAKGKAPVDAAAKSKAEPKAKATAPEPKRKARSTEGAAEAKAAATMTSEEWKKLQVGMDEKWPVPAYTNQRDKERSHTSYMDETYEAITRWCAETKISYRPHAKSPGSKSHIRYEEYSKATTAAEALDLGSWPADWCWDYERGFIKVEGPLRDEPLDISKIMDESTLTAVDLTIHRWYRRELAKNLGLDYKDLGVGKGGGESTLMRAHRLVAERESKQRLEAAAKEKRKITKDEVLKTLQRWAFARNTNRQNVLPDGRDWVRSDTLGLLRDRTGDIHLTSATKRYPQVMKLLNKFLSDHLSSDVRGFKWTSINLNCNYAARLHRDGNNFGPSFITAVGDFEGGELCYWPEDDRKSDKLEDLSDKDKVEFDLSKGLALFNGNCGHAVNDFTGERFSIVYFTIGCYDQAPSECKAELSNLGVSYPASDEDRYALLRAPRGYGSSKGSANGKTPAMRFYPYNGKTTTASPVPTPSRAAGKKRAAEKEQPSSKKQSRAEVVKA